MQGTIYDTPLCVAMHEQGMSRDTLFQGISPMSNYQWWEEHIMSKLTNHTAPPTGALPAELSGAHISLRFNAPTGDAAEYVHNVAANCHWFTTTEAQQPGILRAVQKILPDFHVIRVHEYMFGVNKSIYRSTHQAPVYHQFTADKTIATWRNEFVGEATFDIVGGYILRLFSFHSSTSSSAPESDHITGYRKLGQRIARNKDRHWWIQAVGSDTNRQLHIQSVRDALTRELDASFAFAGREPDGGSHYDFDKAGKATIKTNRWIDAAWVTGIRPVSAEIADGVPRPLSLDHVAVRYQMRK